MIWKLWSNMDHLQRRIHIIIVFLFRSCKTLVKQTRPQMRSSRSICLISTPSKSMPPDSIRISTITSDVSEVWSSSNICSSRGDLCSLYHHLHIQEVKVLNTSSGFPFAYILIVQVSLDYFSAVHNSLFVRICCFGLAPKLYVLVSLYVAE